MLNKRKKKHYMSSIFFGQKVHNRQALDNDTQELANVLATVSGYAL